MEEQGCEWVTPHVMRHSFASILASAGKSIFKISEWLGDSVRRGATALRKAGSWAIRIFMRCPQPVS
jgi:integrase